MNVSKDLKTKLLNGVSIGAIVVAVVAIDVNVVNVANAATIALSNATVNTAADGTSNTITTSSDAGIAFLDATSTLTVQTAAITNDTTIAIGTANGTDAATNVIASTITAGKTLTVVLGQKSGVSGLAAANSAAGVVVLAGLTGATANVGSVVIHAVDTASGTVPNEASVVTIGTITATSLDTLTIRGGNGGVLGGGALTVADFGAGAAISVNTLNMVGGTGGSSTTSAKVGGALIISEVTGAVSGVSYTIAGGAGGAGTTVSGGVGGATILTLHSGAVSSTTFNVNAGDGGAGGVRTGGAGGAMTIAGFAGDITSSTINVSGGDGGNGADNVAIGTGGAGGVSTSTVTGDIGVVATPVTLNITGGTGGAGGSAGASANDGSVGGAGGAVAGFTSAGAGFAATTISGGAGGDGGAGNGTAEGGLGGVGGAVTVDFTTGGMTGALVVTGGDGGDGGATGSAFIGGAGAVGGATTLTDFSAQVGAVTITAGDGGSGANASTTINGAAGDAGGLVLATGGGGFVTFAGSDAAVGANFTVTAGNAGNAGDAATTGDGGAAAAGGNNTIAVQGTGDFAALVVTGGNAGDGGDGGTGADGDGGANAAAGIAKFTQTGAAEATSVTVTGGNAGNGGNDGGVTGSTATQGAAGGAATATFTSTLDGQGAVATAATTITVTGGTGGNGGNGGAGQAGVNGLAGGAAVLNLNATSIANITLDDGTAGTAGTTSTNAGGTAGAGGAASVIFTGTNTFTGNILAATDGEGTVDFNSATNLVGSIGVDGTSIKLLDISETVINSVSGSIFADEIAFSANAGTLVFDGTSATTTQIVSGNITNAGTGVITAGATAPIHFKGTVAATTFTLNGAGTVTFEKAVTTATDFDIANLTTITLGEGIVAGQTVVTATQAATAFAGLGAGTAAVINLPQTFTSGSITLIDYIGSTSGASDALLLNLNDSVLATYTAGVGADATKLDITATKKSSASIATALGVSATEAVHLDAANTALVTGDAAALTALNNVLIAGGTGAKLAAETIGLQADTLGASASASMNTGGVVSGIASNRLASLRSNVGEQYASAGQDTGFNAGSGDMSKNFWMKGFGTWAEQDASGGIDGYDADTTGFSAGFDMETAPNYRLGASIGISNTDVDGEGSGKSEDAIASKQFTLYGDYTASNYFLEGSLGYAMNSSDKQRTITIGNLVRIASADDVDSDQFMWNVSGGMPMSLGGSTVFTPRAGMAYTLLKTENYTETGAVNLNQTVVTDDVSAFILSIGGKIHTKIPTENGNFVPSFHAGASYDLSGEEVVSQSTFTGGGAASTNTGAEQEQFAGNFGGGLAYEVDEASVGFTYDLSMKDGYSAHSGMLEAQFKF